MPIMCRAISGLLHFFLQKSSSLPALFPPLCRTTEQQQRFHEICGNLVKTQRRVLGWWKRLFTLKEEKPKAVRSLQVHRHKDGSHSLKGVR